MADPRKASKVAAVRATLAGGRAYRDGTPIADAPWRGDTPFQSFMLRYWIKGWQRASAAARRTTKTDEGATQARP